MGASEKAVVFPRLKREEHIRTKHDSAFSDWKILIGHSDWEDYLLQKDGAEKYRTQNLPNCSSCPGLYEFGIALSCPKSGREASKLKNDSIIPVYLGQANNVRTRLQQYGREGAHLENGQSKCELNDGKGQGLFTEIFSRGFPIVFRWAPMKSKRDAEKTEAKLLDTFDYAWNKGSNGARRSDDILKRLDCRTSSSAPFAHVVKKFQMLSQRKVGLRLEKCKPLLLENGSSFYANQESNDVFSQIFKFGRSRPRLVSNGFGVNWDSTNICGVALGQGSVCIRPPIEGRKRCAEHKGMKVNGSTIKLITEEKPHMLDSGIGFTIVNEPKYDGRKDSIFSYGTTKLQPAGEKFGNEGFSTVCKISLDSNSHCEIPPVPGRKRCEEHKGMKITSSVLKTASEEREHYVHGPVLKSRADFNYYEPVYSGTHKLQYQDSSVRDGIDKDYVTICGVDTKNGRFCTRRPVIGRKRCEEHKGMRVNEKKSNLLNVPSVFTDSGPCVHNYPKYNNMLSKTVSSRTGIIDDSSLICGATTRDGSACRRKLTTGNKYCWQHEGTRVGSTSRSSSFYESTFNASSSRSFSYRSSGSDGFQSTCGATTRNGSFCKRSPAQGRRRCWQH